MKKNSSSEPIFSHNPFPFTINYCINLLRFLTVAIIVCYCSYYRNLNCWLHEYKRNISNLCQREFLIRCLDEKKQHFDVSQN